MIRLFKVKEKQKEQAENANGGVPIKKQTAGELRLHKDISELNLPKSCTISFPNGKDDLMNFEVSIRPDEGYYLGGTFVFSFQVSPIYPHEAPKVKCKTKVYHPNIDLEGNVCLNILREDWKPVLSINTIIYGLFHLFTEPNYEDPLNHDAAAVLRNNPKMFESNVRRAMTGGLDLGHGLKSYAVSAEGCFAVRALILPNLPGMLSQPEQLNDDTEELYWRGMTSFNVESGTTAMKLHVTE